MALTNAGVEFIAKAITGNDTNLFTNATTRLGVGNGTTAFSPTQTDLQGTSKLRKSVDGGYPVVDNASINLKATFEQGEANFAWAEWGVFNADTGGVMLNRVVESNGTKQSNQVWVLEVRINFVVGYALQ